MTDWSYLDTQHSYTFALSSSLDVRAFEHYGPFPTVEAALHAARVLLNPAMVHLGANQSKAVVGVRYPVWPPTKKNVDRVTFNALHNPTLPQTF